MGKDGRTEGRKDGRTEGRKDGRTEGRKDGAVTEPRLARLGRMLLLAVISTMLARTDHARAYELEPSSTDRARVWLEEKVPGVQDLVSNEQSLELTGATIHKLKFVPPGSKFPETLCFDGSGKTLDDCGNALRVKEDIAKAAVYGRLDPELWKIVQGTEELKEIPVMIWLAQRAPAEPTKEEMFADMDVHLQALQGRLAAIADARTDLEAEVSEKLWNPLWFASDAPVAWGNLSPVELWLLNESPTVGAIYYSPEPDPQWSSYPETINAVGTGFDGGGEKVCVIESKQPLVPNGLSVWTTYCGTGSQGSHARAVTGVIRSTSSPNGGVAPNAWTSVASWDDGVSPGGPCSSGGAFQWCSEQNHPIWNWSHTCGTGDEKLFDYYAKRWPYPFISAASGNINTSGYPCGTTCVLPRQAVGCAMYNSMVVGGSNDCGTAVRTDDRIWCPSKDVNRTDGRELPLIVAPSQFVDTEGGSWTGTSFAAPQVAGAAAQLIHQNSSLRGWPEAIRSILMASATETVDGFILSLHDSSDDRDGAGELSVSNALIVGHSSAFVYPDNAPLPSGHYFRTMTETNDPAGSTVGPFYVRTPYSNKRVRVVISWGAEVDCPDPLNQATCGAQILDADLDLYVYDHTGHETGSWTGVNNYEFIDIPITANRTYTIILRVYSWLDTSYPANRTYMGLAWHTGSFSLQ